MRTILPILLLFSATLIGCEKKVEISADDRDFEENIKTQLITAEAGTVIQLPEGTFQLSGSLTLKQDGVTIRGAGMDRTILSFRGQTSGSEGISVTASDFTIEDLAIEDTKGDALKINGGENITIRRVRTEWTDGPDEENGAYGIYPVQCERVLIEEAVAIAASDAGIYVGQSKHIIVRNSRAEYNVAGIEIENSQFADVHDNIAINNTGGILIFDLPDLPVQGGQNTRVFDNEVRNNNTDNFAPAGNIVAMVPAGTGLMVMANDNIEVFGNRFENNQTANIIIASYYLTEIEIKDESYDPIPEALYIHDNTFVGGGDDPTGGNSLQSTKVILGLTLSLGTPFPDIIYDGIVTEDKLENGSLPDDRRICISNNGDADFANLDAMNSFENISRDMTPHDCTHPRQGAVTL